MLLSCLIENIGKTFSIDDQCFCLSFQCKFNLQLNILLNAIEHTIKYTIESNSDQCPDMTRYDPLNHQLFNSRQYPLGTIKLSIFPPVICFEAMKLLL